MRILRTVVLRVLPILRMFLLLMEAVHVSAVALCPSNDL